MDTLLLACWQSGLTMVYHFLFVPLTLGLVLLVALMETLYVTSGNDVYKRMTRFWGQLYIINYALGFLTGLLQEFQCGMSWSVFSSVVGNIFGIPLAIEAVLAFFLDATFFGMWLASWGLVSKRVHLSFIWLTALGVYSSVMQRLAIARAFLKDAPFLILEEPTTNLDVLSEQAIIGSTHAAPASHSTADHPSLIASEHSRRRPAYRAS